MKEQLIRFISRGYTILLLIAIVFLSFSLLILWGPLRAMFALFILFLLGLIVVQELMIFSNPSKEWERTETLDDIEHLLMPSVQVFVKGAIEGSEHSRERVHDDIHRWFLSKVKSEKGLSDDLVEDMLADREIMESIIQDEKIERFLMHGYTGPSFAEKKVKNFISKTAGGKDRRYERWLKDLLKHMEEWE